jgi:hypothetical protein
MLQTWLEAAHWVPYGQKLKISINLLKMAVFWDVAPCSLVNTDRSFRSLLPPSSRHANHSVATFDYERHEKVVV